MDCKRICKLVDLIRLLPPCDCVLLLGVCCDIVLNILESKLTDFVAWVLAHKLVNSISTSSLVVIRKVLLETESWVKIAFACKLNFDRLKLLI